MLRHKNITVKKGDRIYFRVQSGTEERSNGAFDNVKWAPVITYTGAAEHSPADYLPLFINLRRVPFMMPIH